MTTTAPVLTVESLHVSYGGVRAVRDVSLEVRPGESLAVLGANGAGKTSLLRAISRLVPHEGSVTVAGEPTAGLRPEQVARLGVAHVPDHRGIFDDLTVRENLTAALYGAGRTAADDALARVHDLFPILAERADQQAGTMSGGQQQMLTIARALVQDPTVLLVDEMSMGLAPSIVEDLFGTVDQLTSEGLGVVLVEQFVAQALAIVDQAVVLAGGQVVAAGTAEEVAADDVAAHYLGGTDDEDEPMPDELAEAELPDSESVPVDLNARELRALQALAAAQDRTVSDLLTDAVRRDLFAPPRAADGNDQEDQP